tara:strand:+ start:12125 stop:12325 length:201 start_codon:yes stop_codon:yes gene_type:complete
MNKDDREWMVAIRGAIEVSRLNLVEFMDKDKSTAGLAVALQAAETARQEVDYFLETGNFGPSEVQP